MLVATTYRFDLFSFLVVVVCNFSQRNGFLTLYPMSLSFRAGLYMKVMTDSWFQAERLRLWTVVRAKRGAVHRCFTALGRGV